MISFIDLFAGIGGLSIPFRELGYDCVFTSELNRNAQLTYRSNFGYFPHGDITKISEKSIPDHNLLLAGFPCQPFSMGGNQKGFEDTRGTLFFEILRILKEKQPEVVLLENVKGLIRHDNGNTLKTIIDNLELLNYQVYTKLYNSKNFKLPQNRERIFIVCLNKNKLKDLTFNFPKETGRVKVKDILDITPDLSCTLSDKKWEYLKKRKIEQDKKTEKRWWVYHIVDPNSTHTRTLTTGYSRIGSEILLDQSFIGLNPRKLSVTECCRLQGFPDTFKFPVSKQQAYRQLGNSVPINVVREISKQINLVFKRNGIS